MNTDVRIDWYSGMEITPQTFIEFENTIAENRMLIRRIVSSKVFGVVPKTKFKVVSEVVGNALYLRQISCNALLPSGQVIVIESAEEQCFPVPERDGCELYFTVDLKEDITRYDRGGLRYVANAFNYAFKSLPEIKKEMPLLKLLGGNKVWNLYKDYVPPMISVRSSIHLMELLDEVRQSVRKILEHDNLPIMNSYIMIHVLCDQLFSFAVDDSPRDMAAICEKIASALGYELFGKKPDIKPFNLIDAEQYFKAFSAYVANAVAEMDNLKPKMVVEVPDEPEVDPFCPII
ncbi:MAG: hypothetical protein J6P73_05830 [Bacteroidales bacterium]|nr:hypothetical protein [Bacteroidales bacterium]